MIRKYLGVMILAVLTALSFYLSGCASEKASEKKEIVIQVNASKISLEEFNDLMKFEAYADPEMDVSDETREQFIQYLIRKELLIQEAARLKLDTKKDFVLTIEKYWEATLIRNLLELKTVDLKKKVLITEDEIEAYYSKNKEDFDQPLDQVRASIKDILESEKLEAKLEEWTQSLRDAADININQTLISGK
ncbi:MAG: SurA N-terminal domain-containing protein [Proteobacteria bacterium]|nr:hypothetical protein [Desulfobacula sp.]MBU3951070.1 SurA N-terminal domain-containing protein [Pseudomonadota bacterium]MBU4130779.1 SurA N-terminal domain-containing protein [Pseudomonadota bacterium]